MILNPGDQVRLGWSTASKADLASSSFWLPRPGAAESLSYVDFALALVISCDQDRLLVMISGELLDLHPDEAAFSGFTIIVTRGWGP
jgi:hypothetical protein